MKNATLEPEKHTTSPEDAFWYGIVKKLTDIQAFIMEHMIKEPVWRSFDGTVHVPRTMTDRHLYNTLMMLSREGETGTPIYRAILKEYERREQIKHAQVAEQLEKDREKNAENAKRRKTQLDNYPPFMVLPNGWAEDSATVEYRSYRHMSGAKVFLGNDGYWLWFKANRHHIQCRDKKETPWAAMEAALGTPS